MICYLLTIFYKIGAILCVSIRDEKYLLLSVVRSLVSQED